MAHARNVEPWDCGECNPDGLSKAEWIARYNREHGLAVSPTPGDGLETVCGMGNPPTPMGGTQAGQNHGPRGSVRDTPIPPGGMVYLVEGINPQPWEASQAQVIGKGRKVHMYKPDQLRFYQQAVAEAFQQQNPNFVPLMTGVPLQVWFYFWREIEVIEGPKGEALGRSNVADATNLQKGLEDALQSTLYGNDQLNVSIRSRIVRQEEGIEPRILIMVAPDPGMTSAESEFVVAKVRELHKEVPAARSNIMPGSNDDLF